MNCYYCKKELTEKYEYDSDYVECPDCKVLYRESNFNEDWNDCIENLKSLLESDLNHYKNKVSKICSFFKSFNKKILTIDLGGCVPKLPYFFSNKIIVVDLNVNDCMKIINEDENREIIKKFVNLDNIDVNFIKDDLLYINKKSVKKIEEESRNFDIVVISLIHVIEHFDPQELKKTINTINKIVSNLENSDDVYIVIYGPNYERFKDKSWLHNLNMHKMFLSVEKLKEIFEENLYNLIYTEKIDEDYLLLFKYEKITKKEEV